MDCWPQSSQDSHEIKTPLSLFGRILLESLHISTSGQQQMPLDVVFSLFYSDDF